MTTWTCEECGYQDTYPDLCPDLWNAEHGIDKCVPAVERVARTGEEVMVIRELVKLGVADTEIAHAIEASRLATDYTVRAGRATDGRLVEIWRDSGWWDGVRGLRIHTTDMR